MDAAMEARLEEVEAAFAEAEESMADPAVTRLAELMVHRHIPTRRAAAHSLGAVGPGAGAVRRRGATT